MLHWLLFPFTQKRSFIANCSWRDEPDSPVGKRVAVTRLKLGLPAMLPGWPKFAWLKRSKNSVRNWKRVLSPSAMFLLSETSVLLKRGPVITLRPRLPKRSTWTKTEVSNQWLTLPVIFIGPVTSGLRVLLTPFTRLLLVTMLIGFPLCAWTIALSCKPE